jgi:hypothetical protein
VVGGGAVIVAPGKTIGRTTTGVVVEVVIIDVRRAIDDGAVITNSLRNGFDDDADTTKYDGAVVTGTVITVVVEAGSGVGAMDDGR